MASYTFFLYQVDVTIRNPDETLSFEHILRNLPDSLQVLARNGNQFTLDERIRQTQGVYYGAFCLYQTTELPPKVKLGEEPEDLLSDNDAGLGYYTAFFYDPTNNFIGVQVNQNGISASGIAYFFKRNSTAKEIDFRIVIDPEEFDKLDGLSHISNFDISIAKPVNASQFASTSDSATFKELMSLADKSGSGVLKMHLGTGYGKSSLNKNVVKRIAKLLLRKATDYNVTKIEIKGRENEDDNQKVIDLINNKVKLTFIMAKQRSYNRSRVKAVITKAIEEYSNISSGLSRFAVKATSR
ncbi:MAG TPA: DUF6731 family protein [Puia sp.]|nr:DUF6731 family protein [Puia sp.]